MTKIDFIKLDPIFPKKDILLKLLKKNFKKEISLFLLSFVFVSLIIVYSIVYSKVGLITSICCLIIYIIFVSIHMSYKIHIEYKASKSIKIDRSLLITDLYTDLILKNKNKENVVRITYDNLKIKEKNNEIILYFDKNKLNFDKSLIKETTLNYLKGKINLCM